MPSNVAPTGLAAELARRAETDRPVRIGLIGCGEMGTDIVVRTAMMSGIEVSAICEVDPQEAHRAVEMAYQRDDCSAYVSNSASLNSVVEERLVAVTDHSDAIVQSELIDVVVDATGVPAVGAEIGLAAISHGKHLVMMNVEADVTIGPILRREADQIGVVYSLGAGDEPSACMELIEFVSAMGHRIVCAGKGKNNPLNPEATPDQYAEEAAQRNMNPRLLSEFIDGSKTMVEMTAIANATGLVPDVDGMHGPAIGPTELATTLIPKCDGGLLSGIGRVDYSTGRGLAPGVFVVFEAQHPRIRERLTDLKMGKGPYYSLVRPYHLTSLEVPLTCARAVMAERPDMAPLERPVAEVCAVAKRDLEPGDVLDQLGEFTYRAWAMEACKARAAGALPAGLLAGAKVTGRVRKGKPLTSANTALPEDSKVVELRRRQDVAVYGSPQF